jgi:hypothetical protein
MTLDEMEKMLQLTDGWECAPDKKRHEMGFFPNWPYYNNNERKAASVVKRSVMGDFAVRTDAILYLIAAQDAGRIDEGWLVFSEMDGKVPVSCEDARSFYRRAPPPRIGPHGRYWWVDNGMRVIEPRTSSNPF